jgi:hypothetical protein
MIAHARIIVLSVALIVGLSALHGASIAGARATQISITKSALPVAPKKTVQSAQNMILVGAAYRSISVGY